MSSAGIQLKTAVIESSISLSFEPGNIANLDNREWDAIVQRLSTRFFKARLIPLPALRAAPLPTLLAPANGFSA